MSTKEGARVRDCVCVSKNKCIYVWMIVEKRQIDETGLILFI